jgi:hypothetical protein
MTRQLRRKRAGTLLLTTDPRSDENMDKSSVSLQRELKRCICASAMTARHPIPFTFYQSIRASAFKLQQEIGSVEIGCPYD